MVLYQHLYQVYIITIERRNRMTTNTSNYNELLSVFQTCNN